MLKLLLVHVQLPALPHNATALDHKRQDLDYIGISCKSSLVWTVCVRSSLRLLNYYLYCLLNVEDRASLVVLTERISGETLLYGSFNAMYAFSELAPMFCVRRGGSEPIACLLPSLKKMAPHLLGSLRESPTRGD